MSTHSASSLVVARLPAMWGRETLATEVSSTSMNVASITDNAISHGLTAPRPPSTGATVIAR